MIFQRKKRDKPEARILTMKEVRKLKPGVIIWEQERKMPIRPIAFESIGSQEFYGSIGTYEVINFTDTAELLVDYGKQYVLWSDRPTEEQMKGVTFGGRCADDSRKG